MNTWIKNKFSKYLLYIGVLELISGLIINPWIGKFWKNNYVNYFDVMLNYHYIVIIFSIISIVAGLYIKKYQGSFIVNLVLLYLIVSSIIIIDRVLLVKFGLPLWTYDTEIHYKHRPNAIRSWGEKYSNKLIKINSYGFHDDEFPIRKNNYEYRAIVFGNSVTMGHGVTYKETFSNILEGMLNKEKNKYVSFQIINAGVQGYSTYQEFVTLKRTLILKPDLIILGFCLNDLTEPFRVNRNLGGTGFDYHKILQSSDWLMAYLSNETGFGRLIQYLFYRSKSIDPKKQELEDVKSICLNASNKLFKRNWEITLNDIQKFYDFSRERKIDIILLIFPYTFQLFSPDLQLPQKILINHAEKNNVKVIDFTEVLENKLISGHTNTNDYSKYFLDEDHYSYEGHKLIAVTLLNFITHTVFNYN